jgi:excisionase family DNA binding protein
MAVQGELDLSASQTPPVLVTIRQAAQMLSLSRSTVYELIRDGTIEVVHVGRSARVPVEAVFGFVTTLRAEPDRRSSS